MGSIQCLCLHCPYITDVCTACDMPEVLLTLLHFIAVSEVIHTYSCLVFAAGRKSSPVDPKHSGLPAQAQHPASRPLGSKASKQAAVASMFKAARGPSPTGSCLASTPTASDVAGSGNHTQATMARASGSAGTSALDLPHTNLAASADTQRLADADLGCGRVVSDSAERDQSSFVGLGNKQHIDAAGFTEAQNRAETNCSEYVLQHTAVGASSGQQQGRSTDAASEGDALHSIDLAEQKQILHELWLERNALSARGPAKRPATTNKTDSKRAKLVSGNSRQTQIFSMLKKPP